VAETGCIMPLTLSRSSLSLSTSPVSEKRATRQDDNNSEDECALNLFEMQFIPLQVEGAIAY
jgi:hypothetical protein